MCLVCQARRTCEMKRGGEVERDRGMEEVTGMSRELTVEEGGHVVALRWAQSATTCGTSDKFRPSRAG